MHAGSDLCAVMKGALEFPDFAKLANFNRSLLLKSFVVIVDRLQLTCTCENEAFVQSDKQL
jgi:hypothetical protein